MGAGVVVVMVFTAATFGPHKPPTVTGFAEVVEIDEEDED